MGTLIFYTARNSPPMLRDLYLLLLIRRIWWTVVRAAASSNGTASSADVPVTSGTGPIMNWTSISYIGIVYDRPPTCSIP